MTISESQLTTWSHQGSKAQSASTYQTICNVLKDSRAPYANRSFDIFLQGSYGNDTNIYADSDVDIVMCLTSVYYSDTNNLSTDEKARFQSNWSAASYDFATFKREVAAWLAQNFGPKVVVGKKAIFVPGNESRRDADVLACAEHRRYRSFPAGGAPSFHEGIVFWTPDGTEIINFPKQHSANCTSKHQATSGWFKPTVRIFKNMRNAMITAGYFTAGRAPSYFVEGMLWNVPNTNYGSTYQSTGANALNWLRSSDPLQLACANDLHWLLRGNTPVNWNTADFDAFVSAAIRYWNA